MKKIIAIILCSLIFTSYANHPENLDTLKKQLKGYHDSGEYSHDINQVTQQAKNYLAKRIGENNQAPVKKKLAIVFDIDETTLSNYNNMLADDFGYIPKIWLEQNEKADDPAISGSLKLYNFAKQNNVAVFFITGRHEMLREVTEKNLKAAGFTSWAGLYLTANDYMQPSIAPFKTAMRQKIESMGYDIVLNIGDQYSDLKGGFEDKEFKLPNPYYYIP